MEGVTRLNMMENAARVLEEKNRWFQQPGKKHVQQNIVYDNRSSFSLDNDSIRANLEIPYMRQNISNNDMLIKYDNSLAKGSRNPLISGPEKSIKPRDHPITPILENVTTNEIADIYQETYNDENIRDENIHSRQPPPLSEKSAFIKHLISQVKFLQPKTTDEDVKKRLTRLLDYLYSGAKSVSNLAISPKNKIVESNFDTGVTFQTYLNYIITPNRERKDKPNFYDMIFGDHIENDIKSKIASKSHLKRNRTKIGSPPLRTSTLRELKLNSKDSETHNNKWLKSICKKISTIEDIITIAASIGFCLNGGVDSRDKFEEQKKYFELLQEDLEDELHNPT